MGERLTLRGQDEDTVQFDPAPHNSVFEAELLDVTIRETKWDDKYNPGQKTKQLSFKFKVVEDGEFKDRWFWGQTSTYFSEKANNKLRLWVQALLDEDVLPAGFEVDTDKLVGMRARIIVHAKERADGSIANWVEEVRPTRNPVALEQPVHVPVEEEPFRVDAGEFTPGWWGEYPERMLQ